jgi:hypothetical protein
MRFFSAVFDFLILLVFIVPIAFVIWLIHFDEDENWGHI